MALEFIKEKWSNAVNTVVIGALKDEGGSRGSVVKCGDEEGLSFQFAESKMPQRPVIAMEVLDIAPDDWPQTLTSAIGPAMKNPVDWALKCEKEFKSDLICLRLSGAHKVATGLTTPEEVLRVAPATTGLS